MVTTIRCPQCNTENLSSAFYCSRCTMYLGDVGAYRLVRSLAEGGFGAVYCGENRRTGYKVAIKLLHKHLSDNEEMQKRFQREVSILQQIRHPHIVNVFDAGMIPDVGLYLVMEWLEGKTLEDYLRSQPQLRLTPQQVVPLFSQLLDGLSHVHETGIIHRDLKPQNLMLMLGQSQPLLKILDFGIAQDETRENLTRTGGSIGTPDFMAPEQITSGIGAVGPHTDLYAVGVLLAWALTGQLAFTGNTVEDSFIQKLQFEAPTLASLGGQPFPPALEAVVRKALQRRPSERYQNAADFLAALLQAAPPQRESSPPPSSPSLSPVQQALLARGQIRSGGTQVMQGKVSTPAPAPVVKPASFQPTAGPGSAASLPASPPSPSLAGSMHLSRPIVTQSASLSLQPPGAGYHPQWYISRPNEEEISLTHLASPGSPVVLWGPELLGKTWMMKYLSGILKEQGLRVVQFSFKRLDEESLSSLDTLLQELALHIADELGGPDEWVERAWKRPGNPMRKFNWLMERKVLPDSDAPLLLAIDRIDAVQGRPYGDDFFGMLRSWAEDAYQDAWSRLRLLMAVSTTPTLLTERSNQSPFNLTPPVYLGDFDMQQLAQLAERYQLPWGEAEFQQILDTVGGHPYLARMVMYHAAAKGEPLGGLLQHQHALYQSYLNRYRKRLQAQPELEQGLRNLMTNPGGQLTPEVYHLMYKAGLVKTAPEGHHQLRYSLYEQLVN